MKTGLLTILLVSALLLCCPVNGKGQTIPDLVVLKGRSYASCQGRYEKSELIFNNRPVWLRTQPDDSRFAFYNADNQYAITGSQWLKGILKTKNKWHGYFVQATNNADDFTVTKWTDMIITIPAVVLLKGRSYASCEGRYHMSEYIFNNRPVWIRTKPDDSRFAFYNADKRYAITGSQWLEGILKTKNKWHGYLVSATNAADDFVRTGWKDMQIIIPTVVLLQGSYHGNCQGRYEMSEYIYNNRPVWIRTKPDDSRFAFYNTNKRYVITGSQWLEGILKEKNKWQSYFISATNSADDFILAEWRNFYVAVLDA